MATVRAYPPLTEVHKYLILQIAKKMPIKFKDHCYKPQINLLSSDDRRLLCFSLLRSYGHALSLQVLNKLQHNKLQENIGNKNRTVNL